MAHKHHKPFDPNRERSLRDKGTRYMQWALAAGAVCLILAAGSAWLFGGHARVDEAFHHESAPPALVGVVELLAEREGRSVESFEGQSVADIATLAETNFGAELPEHWDDFLHEESGSSWQTFLSSYLIAFVFVVSLSLGALFFVLIQHLTRAGWSVVVRRVAEVMAAALAPLALLSLPILLPLLWGDHSLFEWNNLRLVELDELIRHKRPYLNPGFFTLRAILYFGIWAFFGWYLLSRSRAQDQSGDPALTLKMQGVAPVGVLLFALSVNFFAFDFLMSLAPHWFSAIYGVYYFAGAVVGGLATMLLITLWLQSQRVIDGDVSTEHCHDLAKLLFAFNFFWGYIAFSQYMLIWYANIPEETGWFLVRQQNGWAVVSLLLVFGHLLIPFLGLMSRHSRRNVRSLIFWSCWLLVMHWVDLYWNVMPQFRVRPALSLVDLFALAGLASLYLAVVLRIASRGSWIPLRDPRLAESLAFHT